MLYIYAIGGFVIITSTIVSIFQIIMRSRSKDITRVDTSKSKSDFFII